jgi:eukaryotic-like serine/threonine-protein kinase
MQEPALQSGSFRFGPYELDLPSGDLRTSGVTHRLADQPLALLIALLERPGELVTRDELRHKLWPDGTFVDFDHGLNSAVSRLREALNDSANAPRFVETIPRRGYRLLVPVEIESPRRPSATPPVQVEETAVASQQQPADAAQRAAPSWSNTSGQRGLRRWARGPGWALTGVAAIALLAVSGVGLFVYRRSGAPAPQLANVIIDLPDNWQLLNSSPAVSPDGRHIVFGAWRPDGRRTIWHRPLAASVPRVVPHTENGASPFWSPDGRTIGFFAGGQLKVLPIAGGPMRVVCDAPNNGTGTWLSPDTVLFAPGKTGGVSAVSFDRGGVREITRLDRAAGDLRHVRPVALPDGRHFVYQAYRREGLIAMLASADGARIRPIGPVQSHVLPTASGHVLFVRDGMLLAQRLDVAEGRLTGEVTVLADGLTAPGRFFDGRFSASPALLVYVKSTNPPPSLELRVFDRSGNALGVIGDPAAYTGPSLSPDGTRLAVARSEPTSPARDVWVFDLVRHTRTRLTLDPGDDLSPQWSSDGRWLMFSSDRRGERDIYKHLASGEGSDEPVLESTTTKSVNAWSRDGRFVVYDTGSSRTAADADLYVVNLTGDRPVRVLASGPGFQQQADISPDGRLVAYSSSESGRYEVIVETLPDEGGRWQISTDGGTTPLWRGDGRELFYVSRESVMAVDVHANQAGFEWSAPRVLFKIPNLRTMPHGLTVSADGQRFVATVALAPAEPQRLTTLLNWTSLVN